jgi:hypothetical protein
MEAVEQVWQQIEGVPPVKCVKCGHEKTPCLFTPSELKRKSPRCRMCASKPEGGENNEPRNPGQDL